MVNSLSSMAMPCKTWSINPLPFRKGGGVLVSAHQTHSITAQGRRIITSFIFSCRFRTIDRRVELSQMVAKAPAGQRTIVHCPLLVRVYLPLDIMYKIIPLEKSMHCCLRLAGLLSPSFKPHDTTQHSTTQAGAMTSQAKQMGRVR